MTWLTSIDAGQCQPDQTRPIPKRRQASGSRALSVSAVGSITAPLRGALKQANENRVFSIAFH
jgi:hypothetical protein